ncbi:MAG: hypothetical protein JNK02_12930 [Planctomycetes bacterium]|nr:hypothetical protein [Planctomycetota bacterium]
MRRIPLLAALLTVGAGCRAPAPVPAPLAVPRPEPRASEPRAASEAGPEPPARFELALPAGWSALRPAAFEEALARWNPLGLPGALEARDLDDLVRALDGGVDVALRAVLLLAASRAPEARAALRARLERRLRTAEATFPAVDVAVAAALGRVGEPAEAAALEDLARGRRPHPRLAVRAECAAASLALGRAGTAPLLLALLREGTPAQAARPAFPRGVEPLESLGFAQWRAAEALAQHVGVPNPYRPEAPAAERARAAQELERALAARTANRP